MSLQNIGILRSITQLFSVRNPPRGDHSEVAVLQEARERMRQTKGHVLAVLLGEAVAEGGVVWAEGARAARHDEHSLSRAQRSIFCNSFLKLIG